MAILRHESVGPGHIPVDHRMEIGMSDSYSRTMTVTYIVLFAGITGDLNHNFTRQTQFGGTMNHGMLLVPARNGVAG